MPAIRSLPEMGRQLLTDHLMPLARHAFRVLPPLLPNHISDRAMTILRDNYDDMFDRLSDLEDTIFLIFPLDLPVACLLQPGLENPRLRIISLADARKISPDARISGTFAVLMDLMEGRLDGDALFFSRDLSVEGDTEAVVTLRNALDGEDIDIIGTLSEKMGPVKRPVGSLLWQVRKLVDEAGQPYAGDSNKDMKR